MRYIFLLLALLVGGCNTVDKKIITTLSKEIYAMGIECGYEMGINHVDGSMALDICNSKLYDSDIP